MNLQFNQTKKGALSNQQFEGAAIPMRPNFSLGFCGSSGAEIFILLVFAALPTSFQQQQQQQQYNYFEEKMKLHLNPFGSSNVTSKEATITKLAQLENELFGPFHESGKWKKVDSTQWNETFSSWLLFLDSFPEIQFLVFHWEPWKFAFRHVVFFSQKQFKFNEAPMSPLGIERQEKICAINFLLEKTDSAANNIEEFSHFLVKQRLEWKKILPEGTVDGEQNKPNSQEPQTNREDWKRKSLLAIIAHLHPQGISTFPALLSDILQQKNISFDWFEDSPTVILHSLKLLLERELEITKEGLKVAELFKRKVARRWFRNILLQKASKLTWNSLSIELQRNLGPKLTIDKRHPFENYKRDFLEI